MRIDRNRDLSIRECRFKLEFQDLLKPKSSSGLILMTFIRRSLRQFHLDRYYTPAEILSEVYLRTLPKIQEGVEIESLLGWIRATAYNYIRELSRERRRFEQLEDYHLSHFVEVQHSPIDDEEIESKLAIVRQAFKRLTPKEQRLLQLKVFDGLSWQAIQCLEEYRNCTLTTLRKRKERILKKLHRLYHPLQDRAA